jgi:hypothetical protein
MCQRECRTVQRDCGQAPTLWITVMIGTPASKQASEQRSSEAHRQMLASSQRSESRVPLMVPVHRLVDPPLPVHDRRLRPQGGWTAFSPPEFAKHVAVFQAKPRRSADGHGNVRRGLQRSLCGRATSGANSIPPVDARRHDRAKDAHPDHKRQTFPTSSQRTPHTARSSRGRA